MQQYLLTDAGCTPKQTPANTSAAQWLDCPHAQATDSALFLTQIHMYTGLSINALHASDAVNPLHPSHYDSTPTYDRVVFRSLQPSRASAVLAKGRHRLQPIVTQPVTFFIGHYALVTVRQGEQAPLNACLDKVHAAITPHQLMLRFINAQVDAYLALRQPLTDQLDRWQRELLDPRRAFNDWTALLDARLELRKLEALSEEQLDALSELREAWFEPKALPYGGEEISQLRVRLSDICEHIERVLNHAKRLESSVESAIQLHFAAVAYQTNHTVRNLTILTAVFAPLTLLTGFYGMNVPLPWQTSPYAYEWILLGMAVSAGAVLGSVLTTRFFRRKPKQ